jgi:alkylation response protein AidB-like acyl-CoA dehydrogenase
MDLSLDTKQMAYINLIRELGEQKIVPYSSKINRSSDALFDWQLIKILGEHNLVCPTIPEEYGGLGLNHFTTALVMEEIAAICPGLAAIVDANVHAVEPLLLAGSEQQKEEYLPALTGKDAGLAAFALTEPTGGSYINGMTTNADKKPWGYVINGQKDYVLNAPLASFILLFAFTDNDNKSSSMRAFIVPAGTPGCIIGSEHNLAALDYARTASISFENVNLPNDLIIKELEICSGYLLMGQTLDLGRALVGATAVGIARAAYDLAREFADSRLQNGAGIRQHQVIAHTLADMATKIELARLMTWKACWLIDQGGDYTVPSAMAKVTASTFAQQVTCMASDIMAAQAFEKDSFIEQLVRDARVLSTLEGTNNIQKNLIASLL